MRRAAVLGVVVMLAAAGCFAAQLRGRVIDASGAVVPEVTVTMTSVSGSATVSVSTGPDGLFSIANIPPGTYSIELIRAPFDKLVETVTVATSGLQRDFTLQLRPLRTDKVITCGPCPVIEFRDGGSSSEQNKFVLLSDISRYKLPPPYFGWITVRQQ